MRITAASLAASFSYLVATRLHCLSLLMHRSITLRPRERALSNVMIRFRFEREGMTGSMPRRRKAVRRAALSEPLSPAKRWGRSRGRPRPTRLIAPVSTSLTSCGASCFSPPVSAKTSGFPFIPAKTTLGLAGDNRSFSSNAEPDTFRVKVDLDFADYSKSSIDISSSHYSNGSDAGAGHDLGSTITWNGNTATVHISKDGEISISGTRSDYPAFEAYSYNNQGQSQTLGIDSASIIDPFALPWSSAIQPTSPSQAAPSKPY